MIFSDCVGFEPGPSHPVVWYRPLRHRETALHICFMLLVLCGLPVVFPGSFFLCSDQESNLIAPL